MSKSILIIDDTPENIDFVREILCPEFNLKGATNGQSGIKIAQKYPPDLILLDILMPEMDGYEVLEQLQQHESTKYIPIIFLTALTDKESTIKGLTMGVSDYVSKPFNPGELTARINMQMRLYDTEKALRKAAIEMTRLNANKDKFISIIADKLKRPLGGINSILGILDEQWEQLDNLTRTDYISIARHTSNGLQVMAKGLLDWSALQNPDILHSPKAFDPIALIEDIMTRLGAILHEKKQTIQLETTLDPLFIHADQTMIAKAFTHLIRNASIFSPQNSEIKIIIDISGDNLVISIVDQGVGISTENQAKLFRLDEQFSTLGTDGELGTGMGLILTQEIILKHGGNIALQSQLDDGTTVTVNLPLFMPNLNANQ